MNSTVTRIVDILFQDTVENEETRALHEEVMNNCQEHYADLIARGMGEDEAVGVIVESLKGMKDVIDEYPRKEKAAGTSAESDPAQGNWVFSGIDRIRTDLRDQNIEITNSADHEVHMHCNDPERIEYDVQNGCLTVRATNRMNRAADAWKTEQKPEEISLQSILNFVGRVVKNVSVTLSNCGPLEIAIPKSRIREIELNTASGDIHFEADPIPKMTMHSASGDIYIRAEGEKTADRISASTASGDVKLEGNAAEAEVSSMSGNCTVNGAFDYLKVRSVSGDSEFNGTVNTLTIQSVSGDAEANISNRSVERIEAKSTSGDVEITLPDDAESVHAECSSRSGKCRCGIPDAGSAAATQIRAGTVSGDIDISR